MNKTIFKIAMAITIAFATTNSYAQVNKKNEKAREDLKEAQQDLKESKENLKDAKHDLQIANKDSIEDYLAFKQEAEKDIAMNKQTIATLKDKKWSASAKARAKYNTRIEILERKNNKLEIDIQNANHSNVSKWLSFKKEFKHDMNELGQALKDISVNNVK